MGRAIGQGMLCDLFIKDFAIIDALHLSFSRGLNILSGETGAGKSIIVGALNIMLGGRVSADLIRTGKDEAIVEALFSIEGCDEVKQSLHAWGVHTGGDQLVIRRIISKSGKNKVFISDQLATIQMLTQLGGYLIDISGQYSQQLLLQTERHLDILDTYGGLLPLRSRYQEGFDEFTLNAQDLASLVNAERDKEHRKELLAFQNEEIEKAQFSAGEEDALLNERKIVANAERLYERTYGVYTSIYEAENPLLGALKKSVAAVAEAAAIDTGLNSLKENLNSIVISLEDAALSLRAYADKIPVEPGRLEHVENRLAEIQRMKKKYGKSVAEILLYQEEIQKQLKSIESSSQRVEELKKELQKRSGELWKIAEELSEKRTKAASRLKKNIETELATIGMGKTEFLTMLEKVEKPSADDATFGLGRLHSRGMDSLEYYIAPNVGEEPRPLSRIASGGELSRIVLAIKMILASHYHVATLLFDEVDTGIGGAVAEAVGEKLKEIAKTHQVLCITHLPQIACFGTTHFSVQKNIQNDRTVTAVQLLDKDERVEEITRMLGGKQISDTTRAHALEMLKDAGRG